MPAGRKMQSPGEGAKDVQAVLARPLADGRRQSVAVDARLQAGIDHAARRGLEHDPRLGLAGVGRIEPGGAGVVGMDLDRERLAAVEELQQQGEPRLRMMPAQQLAAVGRPVRATSSRPAGRTRRRSGPVRGRRFPSFRPNRRRAAAACRARSPAAAPPKGIAAESAENEADRAEIMVAVSRCKWLSNYRGCSAVGKPVPCSLQS